ncbi:MAG: hypothetical protein ACUVWX_01845 [Kiritimatiellia bacterium]
MALTRGGKGATLAAEALAQGKQIQQELTSLRVEVQKLRAVLRAVCDLLMTRVGISEAEIVTLVKKAEEEQKTPSRKVTTCPACGRVLQGINQICIYCGTKMEQHDLRF